MLSKILVPVDGSAAAECALPLALALSEKTGAGVRLAVVNDPPKLTSGRSAEAFRSDRVTYVDSITESVSDAACSKIAVSSVLLEGNVAKALCDEVEASDIDLVVMSSHGPPVLMVHAADEEAQGPEGESLEAGALRAPDPPRSTDEDVGAYRHIVVPLDGRTSPRGPSRSRSRSGSGLVLLLRLVMVTEFSGLTLESEEYLTRIVKRVVADYDGEVAAVVRGQPAGKRSEILERMRR